MSTSIVHDGYLARYADGSRLAQLADLPGCFAFGASDDDALQRLAAAIPGYYAWLAHHDDYTPLVQGSFQVVAKESQVATPGQGVFFTPDAVAVTAEDLDWYLALLGWAVGDVVALGRALPASVVAQAGVAGIGTWLTRGLSYVLDSFDVPSSAADGPDADILHWLDNATQAGMARLRSASDDERARVVEREGARWSVRSVLRQAILDARIQLAALEAA